MPTVSPSTAVPPLVLSIDAGSSSVRAMLFDALGRTVEGTGALAAYATTRTPDVGVEVSAPELAVLVEGAVDRAPARAGPAAGRIRAVGASAFWHSLVGVDGEGAA